ncbi:MAG: porin [Pseudomonadota bacterium]
MLVAAVALCLAVDGQTDEPAYAIGAGFSIDNADGMTGLILADLSFNDAASLSATLGTTRAAAEPDDLATREWSLGARYDFGPIGVEARGGQTGDPDDFDADDLMVGIFHSGDQWRFFAQYLERDIDLSLRTTLTRDSFVVSVPLKADGVRVGASFRSKGNWRFSANHLRYDYDRDLSILGGRFIVSRLTPTTLTLATSLLEESTTVGMEIPQRGNRAVTLGASRDTLAGNLGSVDSITVGWLTPIGQRGDLDLSLGASRGDDLIGDETTVFFSALYLFYGLF